ncbi:MAG: hypothetical protein NWE94_01940 [Candidatus Bathyarchaeota archaeon]|nr:hypothetical protein [Candidatus Bathyarchaeota archaeon]
MKPVRILTAFAIVFSVISVATFTVYAQTEVYTYNHGDKAHLTAAGGRAVFACSAIISFEAESKGGWLPNKTYIVNWTLRLDYVNSEFLNGSNFYILFSWPLLETLTPTIPAETMVNQTQLSLVHKNGTISAAFTPTSTSDGFYMNPEFPFAIYVDDQALAEDWASGIWYGEHGTSIGIVDPNATPQSTTLPLTANSEFSTLTVVIVVFATALLDVCAFVMVRKHKATRN